MIVQIQRLDKDLPLPQYAIQGDAGMDVFSSIDCVIAPGERAVIPTGIAIALPEGFVAFAHPRSGLAAKHGISIVNAPGTIDSGYRGEIKIILINTDKDEPFDIKRGDRIAQLVFQKFESAQFFEVEQLPQSQRASGGFGSTGVSL
jgi:dUTP pyrophosphatase